MTQMNITVVDVEPTVDTSAYASGDLMFNPIKIENATSTKGGAAIVQSVAVVNDDALTGSFDLVFTQGSDNIHTTLNTALAGASSDTISDANADNHLGMTSVSNMEDIGTCSIGSKSNIGLVIQSAAGSRDIYVWGIARSTDNPTTATGYKLRFGIIQD
jgi:hypothetical protein